MPRPNQTVRVLNQISIIVTMTMKVWYDAAGILVVSKDRDKRPIWLENLFLSASICFLVKYVQ